MSETPRDGEWVEETRTEHLYEFYGRVLSGYGPSMDPHRCGDPDEPCVTVTEARKVTPWVRVSATELPHPTTHAPARREGADTTEESTDGR